MNTKIEKKRHPGMFKPGQSGNPTGRPKSDVTIRELARVHTGEAIQTLAAIAQNPKATDSARVQACTSLLDRGWGKPAQYVENVNMNMTLVDYLQMLGEEEKVEQESLLS